MFKLILAIHKRIQDIPLNEGMSHHGLSARGFACPPTHTHKSSLVVHRASIRPSLARGIPWNVSENYTCSNLQAIVFDPWNDLTTPVCIFPNMKEADTRKQCTIKLLWKSIWIWWSYWISIEECISMARNSTMPRWNTFPSRTAICLILG